MTCRLVVTGGCYIALICNSAQDLGDGRQCDNTSRPGFRIDPPFAWETAHEAYFGAVASAQDLLEVTPVSTPIWWKQGQICLMADPANGRWGR